MTRSPTALELPKCSAPPYLPYKTFVNFLNGLRHNIPSRIDRSVLRSLSGSVQGQLIQALRYFDLINVDGRPADSLIALVKAEGGERQRLVGEVLDRSYQFVFGSQLDLQRITMKQIEEVFAEQTLVGETASKAIELFLSLAKYVGIKLSPHLTMPKRTSISKRRSAAKGTTHRIQHRSSHQVEGATEWVQLLISKFPNFDPNWSEELKLRWFDSFHELMEREKGEDKNNRLRLRESRIGSVCAEIHE